MVNLAQRGDPRRLWPALLLVVVATTGLQAESMAPTYAAGDELDIDLDPNP